MSTQAIAAINAEIQRQEQGLKKLREELAAIQPVAQGLDACKDRDTIFFLAGWNGCNEGLDAHEQFKKATIAAQAKQGEKE